MKESNHCFGVDKGQVTDYPECEPLNHASKNLSIVNISVSFRLSIFVHFETLTKHNPLYMVKVNFNLSFTSKMPQVAILVYVYIVNHSLPFERHALVTIVTKSRFYSFSNQHNNFKSRV